MGVGGEAFEFLSRNREPPEIFSDAGRAFVVDKTALSQHEGRLQKCSCRCHAGIEVASLQESAFCTMDVDGGDRVFFDGDR